MALSRFLLLSFQFILFFLFKKIKIFYFLFFLMSFPNLSFDSLLKFDFLYFFIWKCFFYHTITIPSLYHHHHIFLFLNVILIIYELARIKSRLLIDEWVYWIIIFSFSILLFDLFLIEYFVFSKIAMPIIPSIKYLFLVVFNQIWIWIRLIKPWTMWLSYYY